MEPEAVQLLEDLFRLDLARVQQLDAEIRGRTDQLIAAADRQSAGAIAYLQKDLDELKEERGRLKESIRARRARIEDSVQQADTAGAVHQDIDLG